MASKTKVKVIAFSVKPSTGVDIGNFFQALESMDGEENLKAYGRSHLLRTRIVNGYITLILLKVSGDKKSVISRKISKDQHQVVTHTLRESESGVEVVLLAINPANGLGIMYNYWKATSPGMLTDILTKANNKARRWIASSRLKEMQARGIEKKKAIEAISEEYPFNFELNIIKDKLGISDILQSIKDLKTIVVSGESIDTNQGEMTPFTNIMPVRRIEYRARRREKTSAIRNAAINIVSRILGINESTQVMLSGLNHEGELTYLNVGDNIRVLDEMNFDDYVDLLPNDYWENFWKSAASRKLLRIIQDYDTIIGTPPNVKTWRVGMKHKAEHLEI